MTLYTRALEGSERRDERTAGCAPRPRRRALADALTRFVFERAAVRGALVSLDATLPRHPRQPPVSAGAARACSPSSLAAAALLASTLKFKGSLIVQLRGDGPVRLARRRMRRRARRCAPPRSGTRRSAPRCPPTPTLADARRRTARGRGSRSRSTRRTAGRSTRASSRSSRRRSPTLIEHYLTTSEQIDSRLALAPRRRRRARPAAAAAARRRSRRRRAWRRAAAAVDALDRKRLAQRGDHRRARSPPRFPSDDVRAVRRAGGTLRLPLLGGAGRQRAAPPRPRRDREHPRRAGRRRRDLRVLQPPLHVRRRRRARAVRRAAAPVRRRFAPPHRP